MLSSLLCTLGWIAILLGAILLILGVVGTYPQGRNPGIGVLVLGVVLVIICYLFPVGATDYDRDGHVGMRTAGVQLASSTQGTDGRTHVTTSHSPRRSKSWQHH